MLVRRILSGVVIAGGVILASLWTGPSVATAQQKADGDGKTLAPLVTWFGPDSAVTEQGYQRITDDDAWLAMWEKHTGKPAKRDNIQRPFIPKVNFEQCMVVAIFKGAKVNSSGVIALSVTEDAKRVLFRFDESTYQTAAAFGDTSGRGGAVDATPFGVFVVPKSSKPLVIEENVQGLKDQPEKWKERARFE